MLKILLLCLFFTSFNLLCFAVLNKELINGELETLIKNISKNPSLLFELEEGKLGIITNRGESSSNLNKVSEKEIEQIIIRLIINKLPNEIVNVDELRSYVLEVFQHPNSQYIVKWLKDYWNNHYNKNKQGKHPSENIREGNFKLIPDHFNVPHKEVHHDSNSSKTVKHKIIKQEEDDEEEWEHVDKEDLNEKNWIEPPEDFFKRTKS